MAIKSTRWSPAANECGDLVEIFKTNQRRHGLRHDLKVSYRRDLYPT